MAMCHLNILLDHFCSLVAVLSDSLLNPWIVARQAHLIMGIPRQEYWSQLPHPSPGHLPHPGIKAASPALADRFFIIEPVGKLIGPFTMIQITVKLLGTRVEADLNTALNMAATDETDQHSLTGKDYWSGSWTMALMTVISPLVFHLNRPFPFVC